MPQAGFLSFDSRAMLHFPGQGLPVWHLTRVSGFSLFAEPRSLQTMSLHFMKCLTLMP